MNELLSRIDINLQKLDSSDKYSDEDEYADIEPVMKNKGTVAFSFSQLEINPIDIADFIDDNIILSKINNLSNEVNEYFVFLVISRDKLLEDSSFSIADSLLYFNCFGDMKSLQQESVESSIIMGIKTQYFYQLQLMNENFIKNLITLS